MTNLEKAYDEELSYYLAEEINYIEDEIEYRKAKGHDTEDLENDLSYLKSLTDKDFARILDKILNDDELNEERNSTIHHHLYHYRKEDK